MTVKITAESGTNIDQKLLTYLTAGTLPDIVQTNDNFAKPYKDNGITQNMIPFAEKTGFPWQDFDPTFLNLGIVDGELHMLPKQGDIILPYVNLRMAQEAGVTPPVEFNPATDSERLDLGRVRDDVQAHDRRRERSARATSPASTRRTSRSTAWPGTSISGTRTCRWCWPRAARSSQTT